MLTTFNHRLARPPPMVGSGVSNGVIFSIYPPPPPAPRVRLDVAAPRGGLSHLLQSCLLYRSCMSKDSARSTGHVDHFFPIKYCVACKKSTLKVLINLGFVTSFEDSHYILLFRYIYGAKLTQWFCYSKHLHVNRNYRPNGTATSLSPKCYSANVPLDFCTTADFEMIFFNEGTAGVLGNT